MPVQLLDGKVLLVEGKVATSEDCCCGEEEADCPCYDDLPTTLTATWYPAGEDPIGPFTLTLEPCEAPCVECIYSGENGEGDSVIISYTAPNGNWGGSFSASGVGEIWSGTGPVPCDSPDGTYTDPDEDAELIVS